MLYFNTATHICSNQNRFNILRFEFDTVFKDPSLPQRPQYVHDSKLGVIHSSVEAVVSKIPRAGLRPISINTYLILLVL